MNLKKAKRLLIVAAISLLGINGCGDDKGANNQDDSYPTEEWTVVQAATYRVGGIHDIVWSGSQFLATGYRNQYPSDTGVVMVSPDGLTWTEVQIDGSPSFSDVTYNGSLYLAVGRGVVYTSSDGLSWTEIDSDLVGSVNVVSRLDTVWVASGYPPGVGIMTSTDGATWIERFDDFVEGLTDFASNDSIIVGVGWGGQIVTSPNAVDWTLQNSPTSQILYGVVWDGSRFLATGSSYQQGGVIIESNNGIDWQTVDSGSVGNIFGIAANEDVYIIVGGLSDSVATVAGSFDGKHWTPQVCEGGTTLHDIVWNGTRFVAVGDKGLIVVSP